MSEKDRQFISDQYDVEALSGLNRYKRKRKEKMCKHALLVAIVFMVAGLIVLAALLLVKFL